MKEKFTFLKDPRALLEIRKHKWIESEKRDEEIGFATAAVDWVKRYGEAWKKAYLKESKDSGLFIEKRRYRRFSLDIGLILKNEEACVSAKPKDINLEAISCRVNQSLPKDSLLEIILKPQEGMQGNPLGNSVRCRARIIRINSSSAANLDSQEYTVVLLPGEECKEFLRGMVSWNISQSASN